VRGMVSMLSWTDSWRLPSIFRGQRSDDLYTRLALALALGRSFRWRRNGPPHHTIPYSSVSGKINIDMLIGRNTPLETGAECLGPGKVEPIARECRVIRWVQSVPAINLTESVNSFLESREPDWLLPAIFGTLRVGSEADFFEIRVLLKAEKVLSKVRVTWSAGVYFTAPEGSTLISTRRPPITGATAAVAALAAPSL
jgi:hypothetical protein